jgi:tRNA(Ile)-lysidine synthase
MPGRSAPPLSAASSRPISEDEFAARMAAFEPFEPEPLLAVAVSGGGDSMALLLLAAAWAEKRGGRVVALTVDHGLRPESAAEAAQTGRWAEARGLAHRTLTWDGPKPRTRLQERARAARIALLEGALASIGALHLLLAHHADDQAETIALRRAAQSGPHGLAGMAAQRFLGQARWLRPLLPFPKTRLRATCEARGQAWFEDPSNRDPRFARARLRAAAPAPAAVDAAMGEAVDAAMAEAARLADRRSREETAGAKLAAAALTFAPGGYALGDRPRLVAAEAGLRAHVLARTVEAVGAAARPVSPGHARALAEWVAGGLWHGRARRRVTLGRCVLALGRERLVIAREARHLPPPLALAPGETVLWDARAAAKAATPGFQIGARKAADAAGMMAAVPAEARASLPLVERAAGAGLAGLQENPEPPSFRIIAPRPAFPAAFTVVWPPRRIMF